ncbi:hypothetical protein [Streptomyces luteireticuli]
MTHDALFDGIAIAPDRERGTLTVSGPAVPEVVVRRPSSDRARAG